jgi:hypothetical protein
LSLRSEQIQWLELLHVELLELFKTVALRMGLRHGERQLPMVHLKFGMVAQLQGQTLPPLELKIRAIRIPMMDRALRSCRQTATVVQIRAFIKT